MNDMGIGPWYGGEDWGSEMSGPEIWIRNFLSASGSVNSMVQCQGLLHDVAAKNA